MAEAYIVRLSAVKNHPGQLVIDKNNKLNTLLLGYTRLGYVFAVFALGKPGEKSKLYLKSSN